MDFFENDSQANTVEFAPQEPAALDGDQPKSPPPASLDREALLNETLRRKAEAEHEEKQRRRQRLRIEVIRALAEHHRLGEAVAGADQLDHLLLPGRRTREELDLPQKMARLRQWCEDATTATKDDGGPRYRFVYVDQESFDQHKPSSFAGLASTFREYQEN